MKTKSLASTPFSAIREVTGSFQLKPGNYVIIPSTFDPGKEAQFMIRIVSETKQEMKY